ncbi:MAG: response regulator [Porticoccaceae bacterium]|jgi:DNA-binding response OmpR family regulator|nr:response regulator [Gammaproteobacteria bacterium]TAL08158.1 MAG: response regulator [Porticoccaceae bacterium]
MRILLVEDDPIIAMGLREGLLRERMQVDHVVAAEPAEQALLLTAYDLAIVDIGLPAMDGLELIRRVRRAEVRIPIMILTARDALDDRIVGLDIGADDYLVKPFPLPELLARIRALIRRGCFAAGSELTYGRLSLNLATRQAMFAEQALELSGREWAVLEHLMLAAPRVMLKNKLVESLSSWDSELTANAVEIYVSRLRTKLSACGMHIRTVRGVGYRLEESERAS